MKWSLRNILTAFFLVVGIVAMYFILKEYPLKEALQTYSNFDALTLILYIIIVAGIFIVLTWRWDIILRSRNIKVPFQKLVMYRIIGTAINFVTPGPRVGGEPTQAALLQGHRVKFTKGLSTIAIDKIIDTAASGLLFILGLILVMLHYSFPRNTAIFLLGGGILFILIVVLFFYRMLNNKHFFLNIFRFLRLDRINSKTLRKAEKKIEEIELIMIDFYNNNSKAFIWAVVISIMSWALMFVEYKLATSLLGLNLGFVELFFIISFIGMAVLFPIPMAVGALEAGQISAFSIIRLSASAGVALAFLVRMKDIAWAIIGFILLFIFGFDAGKIVKKKYRSKINPKIQKPTSGDINSARLKRRYGKDTIRD